MKTALLLLALVLMWHHAHAYPIKPDYQTSPGHTCSITDPDFTEYRYEEQIVYCTRNVSYELKSAIYDFYNVPAKDRTNYTIDHIIPLSIGGSNRRQNLWAEHKKVKATRPDLEIELYEDVRDGRLLQAEAIKIILDEKFKN